MIVNFAVKQQGLEAQLLNTVVKQERADLDRQKNELVVKVAQGKRTQACTADLCCTCFSVLCLYMVKIDIAATKHELC